MSEPKDLLLLVEQLRRSNRRWKAVALRCAALILAAFFGFVASARALMQAEHAMRAERVARERAEIERARAQVTANQGQPR